MKREFFCWLLNIITLACIYSCADIEGLSDDNTVTAFTVTSCSPQYVEFGEVEIGETDVVLPLIYGGMEFPIKVMAEMEYSGPIDKVVGMDDEGYFTFESLEDEVSFTVLAESGNPRRYRLTLEAVPYKIPDLYPFKTVSVSPDNSLLYPAARIFNDTLYFLAINPVYPFSIVPDFSFEKNKLDIENIENGKTVFNFEAAETTQQIIINDKINNSKRNFKVAVKNLPLITGDDGEFINSNLYNQDVKIALFGDSEGFVQEGYRIDNYNNTIKIFVSQPEGKGKFPLNVDADFGETDASVGFVNIDQKEKIAFANMDDAFTFYMIDADLCIARQWKVVLAEYVEEEFAEVVSFSFEYEASSVQTLFGRRDAIKLEPEAIVYPETAEIVLKMTSVYNALLSFNWGFELLNIGVTYSKGATAQLPELKWKNNNSWKESKSFDVVSKNGTRKTWSIVVKDYRDYNASTECIVEKAEIRSLLPLMAMADPFEPVAVDNIQNTISIKLAEDNDSYPMTVMLDYTLSPYARIVSQNNGQDPLVFESANSINTIHVLAEDGSTDNMYTVKLVPPQAGNITGVAGFNVTSISSSYFRLMGNVIDSENREVRIMLSRGGRCPVTIDYKMNLSRKTTTDMPLEGQMTFKNLTEARTFTVTPAESDPVEWKIKFDTFTPQLENNSFEQWADAETLTPAGTKSFPYWTSGNNSYIKGTTRATGKTGYAVEIRTAKPTLSSKKVGATLFLGWFDKSNVLTYQNEPMKLIFQGMEFSASRKVIAIEADVSYESGSPGDDTGAIVCDLIKHNPADGEYIFKGEAFVDRKPNEGNTARTMAAGKVVVGSNPGSSDGLPIIVLAPGEWRRVRLDMTYFTNITTDPFDYTHLGIICSSSSQAHKDICNLGSKLLVDNITIIYED